MKKILYVIGLLCFVSCSQFSIKQQREDEIVIAEIDNKKLYLAEVLDILPTGISKQDSIQLLKNYIHTWARKYLMAAKAEMYLNKAQKNVSREMEDYRLSLLIYRYENLYVEQKIDTMISQKELDTFYQEHANSFILTKPIVKATYVWVKNNAPELKTIRQYIRATGNENLKHLNNLCQKSDNFCNDFHDQWIELDVVAEETAFSKDQCYEALKGNYYMEFESRSRIHILNFRDVKNTGSIMPIEYMKKNISYLIISKRKREMIKNLENSAYNEALDYKRLKIYVYE